MIRKVNEKRACYRFFLILALTHEKSRKVDSFEGNTV